MKNFLFSICVNLKGELNMLNNVMVLNEDDASKQLELASTADNDEAKIEAKRESLLRAVNSSQLSTIEERVAWLLNQFPKTRNSDITLQIRYWQNFQSDRFGGGEIAVSDYYRLAKLTTLTRARAIIQNKLKLFQACDEVKKRRKQLQESEHANARKKRPNCHQYIIYIDESGKTQDNLIVGSMWYLNGAETLKIYMLVEKWKKAHLINDELHFKSITAAKLPSYCELADLIGANSAMLSFKAVSVPRRGIANIHDALLRLASHLLMRGIEHENTTGRATLPRGLSVCKDAEEIGQDKIFAAELSDRMKQAAASQFHDDLYVDEFSAEDSSTNIHLQITDLFTSSLGRKLNALGDRTHPKDQFADYFLRKLGRTDTTQSEAVGDMTAHIVL
jgi:Protein of unknown function (DUF3800)